MFYFRINKLQIFDNHEGGFFQRDLAQVKLMSFVTTDNSDIPNLDALVRETDAAKKKQLVADVVQQVVSARLLTEIDNVTDNAVLTFGDTGYVLYQSKAIPTDFNWCFVAMEGDENVREIGAELESIVNHPDFDGFASNLAMLIVGAVNPAYTAGVAIAKFVTKIAAGILKTNGDDQLGILYMSLNKREHYPHGERKKDDVPDLTNNMRIDYSIFAFDE